MRNVAVPTMNLVIAVATVEDVRAIMGPDDIVTRSPMDDVRGRIALERRSA